MTIEPGTASTRNLGLRLSVVARMLRQDFDRQVAGISVTRSQWVMIAAVARQPGASQRQIAELLEISEASAGRLVDRLCAEKLLERRACKDDRRARLVFVTDAALPLLDQLGAIAKSSEERIFGNFSDSELETFTCLLDKLYANLSTLS